MAPKKTSVPVPVEDDLTEVSSVAPTKTIEKKVRKNAKQNNKPSTRTPSSYVLFSMQYRKVVAESFPDLTLGEVSKKCGEKWGALTEDEKQVWKEKSDIMKKERNPVDTTAEPKKKRKPSSYLCFSMEHRKEVIQKEPNLSLGEVSKRCGDAWKQLSDEEKEKWKVKANE